MCRSANVQEKLFVELIWGQIKGYVARNNKEFTLAAVRQLYEEAKALVTPEEWLKCVHHVKLEEGKYWEMDGLQDEIAPVVINFGDDSEDDSDDDDDDSYDNDDNDDDNDDNSAGMDDSGFLAEAVDSDVDNVNSDNEDDIVCLLCHRKEPPSSASNDFGWVFCDSCGSWIHCECSVRKVPSSLKDPFVCDICHPKMYCTL